MMNLRESMSGRCRRSRRLARLTNPSGRLAAVTNALGVATVYEYDLRGNKVYEGGGTYPVRYTYDVFGNKTTMMTYRREGRGNGEEGSVGDTTTWLRDEATGLVTNKVYADGKGPKYTYTPDGKLATRTWARGIVTTYSYDANGALTNTVYSDGTPTILLAYNRAGRQIRAEDAAGVTTFVYDEFGSVTNEMVVGVAGTNTIERFYDNYGRQQYNLDILLHYGENGLLESISNSVANAKYRYTFDSIDEGYHIALSNGIVVDRKLARDFAQGSVITNITSAVDGVIIENLVYKYDVLKRTISRNTDEFSYNDRNEVISAIIENISKTYGYDEIGNSSFFQANNLNQYSEYEYDSDGNLLSCGELSFGYDGENRLTTVSSNGILLVTNVYDVKSRRVKKATSEAAMTFFYDDWNLIEERIAYTNGTITTIHYYWGKDLSGELQGAGGVSGLLYFTVSNSNSQLQLYIPCYDNNGNITKSVDSNGNIVASYTYDSFGQLILKSGVLADFFRHRFSTKYFDAETGLYYYGYRFYHPVLMRWLNRDPIEEEGGINLYGVCLNNLLSIYDLLGLWSATRESRGDKRRVYKKSKNDTIKSLANEIGMDEIAFYLWARIEDGSKTSSAKAGRAAPKTDAELKSVCYISVPNIWIEADCLRGGNGYDRVIVNQGGTIGSFFGQTLGRWGYHTLKPKTPSELLQTVQANVKDLYGMTVYAHGTPNGYYIVSPGGTDAIDQLTLMRTIRDTGYRMAKANMMQCYSINPKGMDPTHPNATPINFKKEWEKTAVKVYGYEGVNVIGIDF